LPISKLAKASTPRESPLPCATPQLPQLPPKEASNDVCCSSPSNTDSCKENEVNFSADANKAAPAKKDAPAPQAKKAAASKAAPPTPKKASPAAALHPDLSSAIFVRDEFESTGEDVLHFGKGKRKRFLNVRMFPIGEAMSQRILEVSGKKAVLAAKSKPEVVDKKLKSLQQESSVRSRGGSVDTLLSPDPDRDRKSVEKAGEKRRKSAEDLPKADAKKRRSSSDSAKGPKAVARSVIERSKPASDKSKSRVQVDNEVSFKMQNEAKS
jgi:hypothetical protein